MCNMKHRSKVVQPVQIYNLMGMLDGRRIDEMRNDLVREINGMKKGVNVKISVCISRCLVMWKGWMRVGWLRGDIYIGENVGNRLAGRPKKKFIELVKDGLKKNVCCQMREERFIIGVYGVVF